MRPSLLELIYKLTHPSSFNYTERISWFFYDSENDIPYIHRTFLRLLMLSWKSSNKKMNTKIFSIVLLVGMCALSIFWLANQPSKANETVFQKANINKGTSQTIQTNESMEKVTLGAGCFWCIEAIYLNLKGVESVLSGYMGGSVKNPTYRQVVTGNTGHAEVVELTFDPSIISFGEILEVFFETHDPTTLNRQGNDVGTQYRSAIFYYNDEQKRIAEDIIKKLDASGAFNNKIVTEVTKASEFYEAEDYHQNYYELNKSQPYCTYVIKPKMDKFKKVFSDKLKE